MAILEVNNVCKSFKTSKKSPEVEVLKNISFNIEKGEFVTLLGPSGCGKTTLLTMIGGFQNPTSGEVLLEGNKIEKPSSERGYVFQNYALFPWMNVEKNILYSLKFLKMTKEEKRNRLEELLEMSHLKGHEKKYPISLSGGMQQRVAVVRALAPNPKILLLDEPLGAIDLQMREHMQNELLQLVKNSNSTVLMVTHDVSEAVYMSDRVIVMSLNKGEIVADITVNIKHPRERDSSAYIECVRELTNNVKKAFINKPIEA
ncbi:ABC transporter ATP-binding protein SaoA [Brachyspira alvinipulli]|uniref:ABC transporter ATP-binding protein SaoA n=1 Tax=Brachyspira alvinipulli TaxID=84379 RepID=UPI000487176A|nr:ABC transporter ATP-binding protein SaoA [Brachyspira alvinipulli]